MVFLRTFKIFFILILAIYLSLKAGELKNNNTDELKYELEVQAKIIPFYVIDDKGAPVFKLKKQDIDLLVNGEKFPIIDFVEYKLDDSEFVKKDQGVRVMPSRIVFLIFDMVSNTMQGVKRAKRIAVEMIKNSSDKDAFVILQSNPRSGLKYLIGPETEREKVIKKVKKILQSPDDMKFLDYRSAVQMRSRSQARLGTSSNQLEMRRRQVEMMNLRKRAKVVDYEKNLKIFGYSLSQLKYALKTITLPKIIFLLSGGIPLDKLEDIWSVSMNQEPRLGRSGYYSGLLEDTAKSINLGGGLLYIINTDVRMIETGKDTGALFDDGKKSSLKLMAESGGGRYFAGSDIKKITDRILKSTTAYYELAFSPKVKIDEKMKIKLVCKRKGVKINSVIFSEIDRPYKMMKKSLKKLFALNVILGASWSRMVGRVEKVKFKELKSSSRISKYVEIRLPADMINRQVDVYFINLEPKTLKATFAVDKKKVSAKERFNIKIIKDLSQFIVIVEPTTTHCIYNNI